MSSTIGKYMNYTLFGESHGTAIGMTIDGLPAGVKLDFNAIDQALIKRKTGQLLTSQRQEPDQVEWLSGLKAGFTTGAAVTFIIKNSGQRSVDYQKYDNIMRPSHADYTAHIKYKGYNDQRGGGMFSGRLTACYVVAGSIARQLLKEHDIVINADIVQLGELQLPRDVTVNRDKSWLAGLAPNWQQVVTDYLKEIAEQGDSIGGKVHISASGLPVGLGEPPFYSVEAVLSQYLLAVPGLKAISFGTGASFATKKGSQVADQMRYVGDEVTFLSNHNGGVLGGISNGQALDIDIVFKATPSIFKEQQTIDIAKKENCSLQLTGRHDPAFVIRTPIVVESVVAMALYDLWRAAR